MPFVHIQELPPVEGLGAYQLNQMPRRVLEGNIVPYGPMLMQKVYPFMQYERGDNDLGPVMPLEKLEKSPVEPSRQVVGPILAAPVTMPDESYAGLEDDTKWIFMVGLGFLALAFLYKRRK